ncbi:hypothetical protein B0H11DRAFT_1903874 [Mycena galericulata]|nr:hypothetical protein B0H11DRAFT_1903874 [Mycena galericulata]
MYNFLCVFEPQKTSSLRVGRKACVPDLDGSIDPQGWNCEAFQTLHRSGYVVADQLLGKEQYPLLALLFQLPNLPTIMAFYSQRYQCSASDAAFRVLQARLAFCPTALLAVISQQIEAFSGMVEAVGEWDDGEWRSCLAQECTNLVAQEKYGRRDRRALADPRPE